MGGLILSEEYMSVDWWGEGAGEEGRGGEPWLVCKINNICSIVYR